MGVNVMGFFWLTQRAISADRTFQGRRRRGHQVISDRVRVRGIRVNAVSPGIIQTSMHPAESYAALGSRLPPVGHVGQVCDIVGGILFLESSAFITGEIVHIDGGQIAGH